MCSSDLSPKRLAELITLPSLNIRGMASSRIGNQASNVIPATASATIDMRLVQGMDPQKTADLFIEYVRKQGYFVVDTEPGPDVRRAHPKVALITHGHMENPHRTSMELPVAADVIRAVESARGPAVKIPNSGGTGPDFAETVLGMPMIGIPMGNHDNNQHSYNENLRIQNLWEIGRAHV